MSDTPLAAKFPELQPGRSPSLGNFYGIGTRLAGRRDYDPETGSYVTTHCFCVFFIPLIALGAYRVADAPGGGWYCLGKVPLSPFARVGSVAIVLALLATGGGIWWKVHTGSPEYAARQKLKEADQAAAAGQGGVAARLCHEVMDSKTPHAEEGKQKLAGMIENPPGPPSEAAAVYAVAVDLYRENRCPVRNLFDTGKAVAARFAETDPAAALDLLEIISPFAPDLEGELAVRLDLLEKLHAHNPNDLDVISRLAAACDAKGDRTRCEKLLAPHESALGTREGAAILGRILADQGQHDRAYKLLKPFVDERLPLFRAAEENYSEELKAAQDRAVELLKSEKAPGFDYVKLDRLPKQQQGVMIQEYVANQVKGDPALRDARKRLMAERGAIPAALELGLVQLHRGEKMADPAARKTELEAAEQTFLSIRGFAGESDEYRLSLGRVYYWLGRQADGKKLFEELMENRGRTTEVVLLVASSLRNLGDVSEARKLVERAYDKESDAARKHEIASFRAVLRADTDEEILWLSRANTADSRVQASLAFARGNKARVDGNDEEAKTQYRRAIELYDKMDENGANLNNSALAHFGLFEVVQDRTEFTRGMDKLDRAIALQPSDSIPLLNGASSVMEGAITDVIGRTINFRLLKQSAGMGSLPYLYRGAADRNALFDRLTRHPGMVKARTYADKLLILAPKGEEAYMISLIVHSYARDLERLKGLLARLEKADLDHGDSERRLREFLTGTSDARRGDEARKALARATDGLSAAQGLKDRTFAFAVGRYVRDKIDAWSYGASVDADELVRLAEEAHAAAPSNGTASTLSAALLFRAHTALCRADVEYAKVAERTKRSIGTMLVYYALSSESSFRVKAVANPDVKRLAALALEDFKLDPEGIDPKGWVVVHAVRPAEAAPIAAGVKANERQRITRRISRLLSPLSATSGLDDYFALLLEGKSEEAQRILADLKAKKIPVP